MRDDLATMNWWWVAVALLTVPAMYLWQAVRWQTLLRPVERVRFWECARAIFVGLFANEILPFRVGELLRCYLISSRTSLPLSVSITSAVLERVFDGIWLCAGLAVLLETLPVPKGLVRSGLVLSGFVVAAAVLLSFALFRRHHARALLSGSGWQRHVRVLIDDLETIGHSRYLLSSFLQSLPFLLLQIIPTLAAFRAYGFDLGWKAAFALVVILRLGAVIPQAPGNLGLFNILARESLQRMYGVVPAEAARFSVVLWGLTTIPLLIAGAISLTVAGLKFSELHHAARAERASSTPLAGPR